MIRGTEPAQHGANLILGVEGRFIDANEAIAWAHVDPYVIVRSKEGEPNRRARRKTPHRRGRTSKRGPHRRVKTACLVHDVRHLRELLTKDDGSQVGVVGFPGGVDQHGLRLQRSRCSTEKEDIGAGLQSRLLRRSLGRPARWVDFFVDLCSGPDGVPFLFVVTF